MTDAYTDPLAEPQQVPGGPCPLDCTDGWVQVKPKYAEHQADLAAPRDTPAWRSAYATHLNSAYPCRICRPIQFFRWAGGHYAPGHDPDECVDCLADGSGRGGRHRAGKVATMKAGNSQTERARRDLEGGE